MVDKKSYKKTFNKHPLTHYIALTLSSTYSIVSFAESDIATEAAQKPADEIIYVKARKKIENIQTVPMGIQAVSAQHIADYGIDDFQTLATYVPSLEQPKLAIQSRLSLRGVSSGDNQSFEQAVGMYVDGIYRGRMNQQRAGFFDMERVEVLKGPQVTLYGNSSIGGAISMITKKPTDEFGGEIKLAYETEYDETYIQAAVNVPLTDALAIRLAIKDRQDEGIAFNEFTQTDEPKTEDSAFRLSALYEKDNLSVHIRFEKSEFKLNGHMMDIDKHVDHNGDPFPGSIYTGLDDGKMDVGNPDIFVNNDTYWLTESEESAIEINYQLGEFLLTSVTGYSEYDYAQSYDTDFTTASMINSFLSEDYQQISQELRLATSVNEKLSYLVGFYYQKDELNSDFFADFNQPLLYGSLFGFPEATFSQLSSPFSRMLNLDQDSEQWALLASSDYQLNDKLTASLSYRFVHIDKEAKQSVKTADIDHIESIGDLVDIRWLSDFSLLGNSDYLADPNNYANGVDPILVPSHLFGYTFLSPNGQVHELNDLSREEDHHMLNLSLSYQLNKTSMLYASFANGAKAGGFDLYNESADPDDAEFEDEKAKVFELGIKNNWSDLQLNLAAFYGEYDNLQTGIFNGGIGLIVSNAPSSIQKGLDIEVNWQINDNFSAFVYAEYLDFYYDDFKLAPCSSTVKMRTLAETGESPITCDWSGESVPFVADYKVNIGLEYYYPLSNQFELRQLVTYSYKDDFSPASDNEEQTIQDAYGLVDYRIDLMDVQNHYQISLSVINAFDEDHTSYSTIMPLAPGGAFAKQLEKGRQIALEASYQF